MFGFSTINILLYFLYPVILISVSIYVSRNKEVTVDSYFFANKNTHWLLSGMSLLTAAFFSPYLFGFSPSGVHAAVPLAYGILSCVMLVVLGWIVRPFLIKFDINTLPGYFEKRFNRTVKFYFSALYIICNALFRLLPVLAICGVILSEIADVDSYSVLLFFLMVTGLYVLIGGIEAESHVNVIQFLLIALGVGIFVWWMVRTNDAIQLTGVHTFMRNSDFTIAGLLIGIPIIGFWFWSADQVVVQKILSVKNNASAKKASAVAILLQIVPLLVFILPGMFHVSTTEFKYVAFRNIFPAGVFSESMRAGITVGVIAAFMTTFANIFNSTSSVVTFDFYRSIKQNASDRELVLIGRMTTIILLLLAILLIPLSLTITFSTCLILLKVVCYIASMVTGIFIVSVISAKIDSSSTMATLFVTTVIIILRSTYELFYPDKVFQSRGMEWLTQIGFLEFSGFIFFFSVLTLFVFYVLRINTIIGYFSKRHKTVF